MTIEKLTINKNSLDLLAENFEHPTASDIKSLRNALGLNRGQLALMVGCYFEESTENKEPINSATVRAWESESSRKRKIPLSAWIIMLTAAGLRPLEIDITCKDKLIFK